jgi:TorA maturation chaperone TorD
MSQLPIPHSDPEGPRGHSQPPGAFTPGPLKKLFADRRDAQFWRTEGMQHSHLFWVRAMLTMQVEEPPFNSDPWPSPDSVRGLMLSSTSRQGLQDARARHTAYGFLAAAWTYPSAEMCAMFATPHLCASLCEAWTRLTGDAGDAEKVAGLQLGNLDRLREEYTRLFYDTYLPFIPPYESVYYNERQVMGKRAAAVIAFYRRAGLAAEGEMPDHIAHECEFVAGLAREEAAARGTGNSRRATAHHRMQAEFLCEHLLPWGVKFCADLACLARGDFYAATARLGSSLFNAEWARMNSVVAEYDYPATIT